MRGRLCSVVAACFGSASMALPAQELELAGFASIEPRLFLDAPAFAGQTDNSLSFSAVLAPELRWEWNDGDDRFTVVPYLRADADDSERSHFDLREANWLHIGDPWTIRVGLGSVFWGVTESRHLVDIVNQRDQVDDIDEEDKLGQPMIHFERFTGSGAFGIFLLPGFRERTFPAADARLRGPLPIDTSDPVYESGAKDKRTDVALRWDNSFGRWDIGLSGFYGTGREPRLVPTPVGAAAIVLVPHYDIIGQVGIDLQYTRNAWLWKLETIRRSGQGSTFSAVAAGVEYTLFGIRGGNADIGLLAEYLYDGRDEQAPPAALDDDLFVGLRFALNDVNDTMILFGAITDRESRGTSAFLEGQRRLWESWRLELELRWLRGVDDVTLSGFRRDSFLTARLARFF